MRKTQESEFQKYLGCGYSIQESCRLTGISLEEAKTHISRLQSDFEDWEILRQHGTKKIKKALDILDQLMDSKDELIRLGAVKTLLHVLKPIKEKSFVQINMSNNVQDDIWTYAKKGEDDQDDG